MKLFKEHNNFLSKESKDFIDNVLLGDKFPFFQTKFKQSNSVLFFKDLNLIALKKKIFYALATVQYQDIFILRKL